MIFLANRQSHAGARIFLARVQPLEQDENPAEVFGVNADSIILTWKSHSPLFRCAPIFIAAAHCLEI